MKAVALLSGGLDSATAYFFACRILENEEVAPLFFDYGQKTASKEKICAETLVINKHNVLTEFNLQLPTWIGSSITSPSMGSDEELKDLPSSFLPGRNILQLTYAGVLAKLLGAEDIYGGWNTIDSSGYPDCQEKFLYNIEWALREGLDHPFLRIKRPLIEMKKSDIVKMGLKLEVPFKDTWSCYFNSQTPCGKCDSCKQRAKAFKEVGVEDPIIDKVLQDTDDRTN